MTDHIIIGQVKQETSTLAKYVNNNSSEFGISNVINPDKYINIVRTGFTWSDVPGTLCLAANHRYMNEALSNSMIAGIITKSEYMNRFGNAGKFVIFSESAAELFYALHNQEIHNQFNLNVVVDHYISPSAQIADSAIINDNVNIGDNVVIHDGCMIFPNSILGNDCEIHAGSLIGTAGFFSKNIQGVKTHIRHYGGVKLGSNCIIHARTNISRSVNCGEFTELADNIHVGIGSNIAHDCKIGKNSDISAGVILAGRVKLGKGCWIGAGSLLSNAIHVGDNVRINIGSVVINDVKSGTMLSGNFAYDHKSHLRDHLK